MNANVPPGRSQRRASARNAGRRARSTWLREQTHHSLLFPPNTPLRPTPSIIFYISPPPFPLPPSYHPLPLPPLPLSTLARRTPDPPHLDPAARRRPRVRDRQGLLLAGRLDPPAHPVSACDLRPFFLSTCTSPPELSSRPARPALSSRASVVASTSATGASGAACPGVRIGGRVELERSRRD